MKNTTSRIVKFVGLKATSSDVEIIDAIVDALRTRDRYTTQSDALRYALQAGLREIASARA